MNPHAMRHTPNFSFSVKSRAASPITRIWFFKEGDLSVRIAEAAAQLLLQDLRLSACSLRHGGASHDALLRRRSLAQIKERGRWKSDTSVARYKKETRALQRVQLIPEAVVRYGGLIERNLEAFFYAPHAAPPPPAATHANSGQAALSGGRLVTSRSRTGGTG